MTATPDLETFREYAKDRRVIPVTRRLLADAETPIGVYGKLAAERPARSCWSPRSTAACGPDTRSSASGPPPRSPSGRPGDLDRAPAGRPAGPRRPAAGAAETVEILHTPRLPGLPPLTGGMVGFLGYDAVRRLERLPDTTTDDLGLPELTFLFATDLAALDHETGEIWLIANAVNWDDSDERVDEARDAVRRLDAMQADLGAADAVVRGARRPAGAARAGPAAVECGVPRGGRACQGGDRAGEAFQIVVSQRFELASSASALDIYRVLRFSNPSPYMYLVRLDGFDIVGSSPEALVKVTDGKVILHPIAGTRRRGTTPEEDHALEQELRADPRNAPST